MFEASKLAESADSLPILMAYFHLIKFNPVNFWYFCHGMKSNLALGTAFDKWPQFMTESLLSLKAH